MNDKEVDMEELASFLDGKLSGEARDRVIRSLVASEDSYALFIETARDRHPASPTDGPDEWLQDEARIDAALREMSSPPISIASRIRRHVHRTLPRYAAVAAGLVLLVSSWVVWQGRRPVSPSTPQLLALIQSESTDEPVPQDWREATWPGTRGASGLTTNDVTAFRLGVRLVDLQIAMNDGNGDATASSALDVVQILGAAEMTQLLQMPYRALTDSLERSVPPSNLALQARRADSLVSSRFNTRFLDFGKWCEAARLAAVSGQAGFFATDMSRRMLDDLAALDYSDGVTALVIELRALLEAPELTPNDFGAIDRVVGDLISELGS